MRLLFNLDTINTNKATGVDKIGARLLRIAAPVISSHVAKLINYSFSSGTFPERWKTENGIHNMYSSSCRDVKKILRIVRP